MGLFGSTKDDWDINCPKGLSEKERKCSECERDIRGCMVYSPKENIRKSLE
jgi:hypothetical protein